MNDNRGPWYLLTGLLVGLALGLVYAWLISPVLYVDTAPDTLLPQFKDQYRGLIALAYKADGDLGRARGRLALLNEARQAFELGAQAQRNMAQGGSKEEMRALAQLAADLDGNPAPLATPVGSPAAAVETTAPGLTPSATLALGDVVFTPTPIPSDTPAGVAFTPRPTITPQPTQGAPFALKGEKQLVCDAQRIGGLIAIETFDGADRPVPGVKINITWDGGENTFYTGLYPDVSPGYADFVMAPGVVYSLRAGEGGAQVNDLSAKEQKDKDGKTILCGWKLTFKRP